MTQMNETLDECLVIIGMKQWNRNLIIGCEWVMTFVGREASLWRTSAYYDIIGDSHVASAAQRLKSHLAPAGVKW